MRENYLSTSSFPDGNRKHVNWKTLRQTLHLPTPEDYGESVGKRGVQWNFSNAGKLLVNV